MIGLRLADRCCSANEGKMVNEKLRSARDEIAGSYLPQAIKGRLCEVLAELDRLCVAVEAQGAVIANQHCLIGSLSVRVDELEQE